MERKRTKSAACGERDHVMAKFRIEITEDEVKRLIHQHLLDKLGGCAFDEKRVVIETKSKQNYRSEWETAAFRIVYEGEV
jgi:hypothetical protein